MTSPQPTADHHADETLAALPDDVQPLVVRASELRRRRAGRLAEAPLATAVPALDRVLGGGLPRGAMVELVGRGSCGRLSTLLSALQQVTSAGEAAALVDQGSQLDPQAAAAVGIDLARLLWLRPERLDDSLAAAEMLVGTGFRLVTLDLGLPPVLGRPPLAAWLRLARSAAEHDAVVLVGSPYRLSGCAAAAVLSSGWGRGRWSGSVGGLRLLDGLTARLTLDKCVGAPNRSNRDTGVAFTAPEAAFRSSVAVPTADTASRRQRHVQNF